MTTRQKIQLAIARLEPRVNVVKMLLRDQLRRDLPGQCRTECRCRGRCTDESMLSYSAGVAEDKPSSPWSGLPRLQRKFRNRRI